MTRFTRRRRLNLHAKCIFAELTPNEAQWRAKSGREGDTKKPGHCCAGLRGKREREAQCLQVLQSVVFLLSQQAEVPDLQHSFFGASGQVPQLVRPITRARVMIAAQRRLPRRQELPPVVREGVSGNCSLMRVLLRYFVSALRATWPTQ